MLARGTIGLGLTAGLLVVSVGFTELPTRTPPPMPAPAKTVEVKMIGDATGFRFAPTTITVNRGDQVRFVIVSGPPHNVAFWPDSMPKGAPKMLQKHMSQTVAPLAGPFLMTPGQSYVVSFADVPTGSYRYYCTPHLALGMTAEIRVR